MSGWSLDAVSERYQHKMSVKRWQEPLEVVVNILMFIGDAMLHHFSARVLSFAHKGGPPKIANQLLYPNLLENWLFNPQWKFQNQFMVVTYSKRDFFKFSEKAKIWRFLHKQKFCLTDFHFLLHRFLFIATFQILKIWGSVIWLDFEKKALRMKKFSFQCPPRAQFVKFDIFEASRISFPR